MKHTTLLLALLTACTALCYGSDLPAAQEHFNKGNEAYKTGEYRTALEHYLAAEQTTEGFAINYNLANTYYKLSKIPEAILHYERALKFEPANADARYNLRLANEKIADRIENIPVAKIVLWWDELRYGLGPDRWAFIAVGFATLSGLSLFLFLLSANPGNKRLGFFAALIAFFIALGTHGLARSAFNYRYKETTAIVFTPKIDVKSEPRGEAINVFVLHAGTKVTLLQRDGEWYEIEIGSGNKGWLQTADVVEI